MCHLPDPDIGSPLFSFAYDGQNFLELPMEIQASPTVARPDGVEEYSTSFLLPDGLQIIQTLRKYPAGNAREWVLNFINLSPVQSGIISGLNDCDVAVGFEPDEPAVPGYRINPATARIINPTGSGCARDDFFPREQFILPGQTQKYANTGGRSCQGIAPFFDINRQNRGVICAIGWSGQWRADFTRLDASIHIQTGIEAVAFRLLPGEQIRTSSIVLMTYEDGQANGHNQFRKLVRDHFSLIGQPGRPQTGPLSIMNWGSIPSGKMISRIQDLARYDFGFEYFWVDAGWYGAVDAYCPNEFVGDWAMQTGNWQVNQKTHPDGLKDVARAVKDNGMKFLLWIEPERVISTNPTPQEHPDWFLKLPGVHAEQQNWLLNLGNPQALAGAIDLVSGIIRELDLDCYRQDFNFDPLPFWRENDAPERAGLNEIKHVMGLYQFWDTLLDRFPHLIIDNCASGGRRIDIELCRRSIPLWRSDYQCTWDADPETAQIHNSGIAWWLPYSGTGAGCVMGDTYQIRSCYSSALAAIYWGYEAWDISDVQPLAWVKKSVEEYKRVRPFFTCDYYLLVPPSLDNGSWAAWQYDRPEKHDGIVLIFRRPDSPFETARFTFGGLRPDAIGETVCQDTIEATYEFADADTGEVITASADELRKNGLTVALPEARSSKLLFYKVR